MFGFGYLVVVIVIFRNKCCKLEELEICRVYVRESGGRLWFVLLEGDLESGEVFFLILDVFEDGYYGVELS